MRFRGVVSTMRAVSGAASAGPKQTRLAWRLKRCGSPKPRQQRPMLCKAHGQTEPCQRLGGVTLGLACSSLSGVVRTAACRARKIFQASLLQSRSLAGRRQPSRRLEGTRIARGPLGSIDHCRPNRHRRRLSTLLGQALLHRRFKLHSCPSSKGLAALSLAASAGCQLDSSQWR